MSTLENVYTLYLEGSHARKWYNGAKREMRRIWGEDALMYCRMFAATSPMSSVSSNVTLANRAMHLWISGEVNRENWFKGEHGFIPAHWHNLNRALQDAPLSGPKVGEFVRALWGAREAIVVDRWMLRAFEFKPMASGDIRNTPKRTREVCEVIRTIAKCQSVDPREAQAGVWFGIKQRLDTREGDMRPLHLILKERGRE